MKRTFYPEPISALELFEPAPETTYSIEEAARQALAAATTSEAAQPHVAAARDALRHEMDLARRFYALQRLDSRLGFEASNHYFFVPVDLAEKMLNCQHLLDGWVKEQQRRSG